MRNWPVPRRMGTSCSTVSPHKPTSRRRSAAGRASANSAAASAAFRMRRCRIAPRLCVATTWQIPQQVRGAGRILRASLDEIRCLSDRWRGPAPILRHRVRQAFRSVNGAESFFGIQEASSRPALNPAGARSPVTPAPGAGPHAGERAFDGVSRKTGPRLPEAQDRRSKPRTFADRLQPPSGPGRFHGTHGRAEGKGLMSTRHYPRAFWRRETLVGGNK
jgi:hypothetical protein